MTEIHIYACIKGYHAYKYKPMDEEKLDVRHEPDNAHDRKAVGVYSGQRLIGHVPATPVPLQQCILNLLEKYVITW